jgi:hypothetical protein
VYDPDELVLAIGQVLHAFSSHGPGAAAAAATNNTGSGSMAAAAAHSGSIAS